MEAPKTARHTSLVHTDSARGMEPLGRLATPDVRSVARTGNEHAFRPGEFRTPHPASPQKGEVFNGSIFRIGAGNGEVQRKAESGRGEEKQGGPQIQEVKIGQNETNYDKLKTPVNNRESPIIEHKKYPTQAQSLAEIFQTTEPLVTAARAATLAGIVAENQTVILRRLAEALPAGRQGSQDLIKNLEIPRFTRNDNKVQADIQKTPEIAALPGMTKLAQGLQVFPRLTVEANRALRQAQETIRVLAPEIASSATPPRNDVLTGLKIVTGAQARTALMTGETEQMQKTFTALSPVYNPEQARTMLATAIKAKTRTMSLPRQAMLLEEMIKNGQAEGFEDDPELILQIIARKQITEKIIEAQVYEPAMRARLANLENATAELAAENDEATGADLVAKLGVETAADRSPIAPDGQRDGGYDIGKAKTASLGRRKIRALYEAAKAYILANPAAEYVSKIVTRKATDQEVYNIKFAQQDMDKIMKFAYGRGMAMLDRMIPV